MHELDGGAEKVCQGAQLLVHRAAVPQLLFLSDWSNRPSTPGEVLEDDHYD